MNSPALPGISPASVAVFQGSNRVNSAGLKFLPYLLLLLCSALFLFSFRLQSQSSSSTPDVLEVIELTNSARLAAGLGTLRLDANLQRAAQDRAQDMADRVYFSHTSPDGQDPWNLIRSHDYSFAFAGENLAINYSDARDLLEAWLRSPTHKSNLLDPRFRDVGVGVSAFASNGKNYTVVVELYGTQKNLSVR